MPKPYTFPTLYNEVLQLSTTKLKEWGYLKTGLFRTGVINWSLSNNHKASISILSDTKHEQPYIELSYKHKGQPVKYKIQLVKIKSNLGKGFVWYFLCPKTLKRCRKLYLIDGYFLHREAFQGCLYECQTKSKKARGFSKVFETIIKTDEIKEQLEKPYFKKYYKGKPTRKYLKILKQIQEAENIPFNEIERLLLL